MAAMIHSYTTEEALVHRHSIRQYDPRPIESDKRFRLGGRIATINREVGLHLQLVCDEPDAFSGVKAKYGRFLGVSNYIALVGPKEGLAGDGLPVEQAIGYYGEELVLLAEQLGLSSCWVGATFSKSKARFEVGEGEKFYLLIALGYGAEPGKSHRAKSLKEVSNYGPESPDWFAKGVATALLAPTALNQQKFYFELLAQEETPAGEAPAGMNRDRLPRVKATCGHRPFAKVDLGIVRYHFALGAGTEHFRWDDLAAPAVPPPKNAVFREATGPISQEAEEREAALQKAVRDIAAGTKPEETAEESASEEQKSAGSGAGFCSGCGGCWGFDSGRRCTMLRR